MLKSRLIWVILQVFWMASCQSLPDATPTPKVVVVDYPPFNWSVNVERLTETGCSGVLGENCTELIRLGCDEIRPPHFYTGGLEPPFPVGECIHQGDNPPNKAYFRQPNGLDSRYRSFVVFLEDETRLMIKQSEFREVFAPVESAEEALSYAMAMTSLSAEYSFDPNGKVKYLVDKIEETHVEETPQGYVVFLFDSDHRMGCDTHEFFAVNVLVTPAGEVIEQSRRVIYETYACFDFDELRLDDH